MSLNQSLDYSFVMLESCQCQTGHFTLTSY